MLAPPAASNERGKKLVHSEYDRWTVQVLSSYSPAATGSFLVVLAVQKRTEERVAMSDTPLHKPKFISSVGAFGETCFKGNKRLPPVVQALSVMLKI